MGTTALQALTVLGLGAILVGLNLTLIQSWDVGAMCAGSSTLCSGVWWTAAVDYLPLWLFLGQIVVVISLASPVAVVRV